jgi:uncharacterized BrkB/YihY/UPF0761 family membrane protein
MVAVAILYWGSPCRTQSFRWISPEAILATLIWLAAAWGFRLYLRYSGPANAYGALGAMIVSLIFLYVSSIVLLIGAEVMGNSQPAWAAAGNAPRHGSGAIIGHFHPSCRHENLRGRWV